MLSSIEEILEDYRQGKMVILTDDEDRENEGDLLIAANKVTSEAINFMVSHARGLVCLTLTEQRCQQLGLPLMVGNNSSRLSTNFTVSIEASEGVTTGISAADRATTIQAAVAIDAGPSNINTPGHIFPLMAQSGGVLSRAGHTEAGVDLARLAKFEPASVICEILKEDGTMARMPDLIAFAKQHDIKISTVADLIRYRREHEPTVQRVAESTMQTAAGEFRVIAYKDLITDEVHLALVRGKLDPDSPTLVRVHVESGIPDVFRSLQASSSLSVDDAAKRIAEEGQGVLVILHYRHSGRRVVESIRRSAAEQRHVEFLWQETGSDLRMLGAGSQILADLGVRRLRVIGSPRKVHGLSGFDLEIVDYVTE